MVKSSSSLSAFVTWCDVTEILLRIYWWDHGNPIIFWRIGNSSDCDCDEPFIWQGGIWGDMNTDKGVWSRTITQNFSVYRSEFWYSSEIKVHGFGVIDHSLQKWGIEGFRGWRTESEGKNQQHWYIFENPFTRFHGRWRIRRRHGFWLITIQPNLIS